MGMPMLSFMRRWQLECPDFFTSGNTETWELTNIDIAPNGCAVPEFPNPYLYAKNIIMLVITDCHYPVWM